MKKVAIITGSSSGIGAQTARDLATQGYSLVINSSKSVDAGQCLAAELPDAIYLQADISIANQCENLIDHTLEYYGQIDVLVNNATASSNFIPHKDFAALTDDIFEKNFNVNVMASWHLAKLAYPHLKESTNGNIINITSIAGIRPMGSNIAYAISKAALNHLTQLLARAMAPKVRVNAVAPGFIETERTDTPQAELVRSRSVGSSLLERAGRPEEISTMIQGILNCTLINGQIITLDGGTSLNL